MKQAKKIELGVAIALCLGISISAIESAYAEEIDEYSLGELIVEGQADAGKADLAGGMMSSTQTVGMFLGEKDVLDVPLHETTFTEEALDVYSQPGRGMLDTLALDPAVRANHGSLDTSVYIRGLSTHAMRWTLNGVPGMSHQMQMPYNFVDQVSIIAGPSIGVTGMSTSMSTQTGGVVNMQSKKAGPEPNAEFKIGWSTENYWTQAIDIGDRFGKNKEWGIRLNALNGSGNLAVDGTHDLKRSFWLNLDREGTHSKTNILFGYDYDNEDGRSNTINLSKSINKLPRVPHNTNNLSPSWSNDTYKNWTAVLNHEQKFSEHMSYFINAGWHKEDYTSWLQQWSTRALTNLNGDYTGTYTQMPVYHSTHYFGAGLKGDFKMGEWKNEYAFSVDRSWFRRARDNNVSDANKYTVTGNIYTGCTTSKPTIVWDPITKQYTTTMTGWSLIDSFVSPDERLTITAGVHHHMVKTSHIDDKTSSGLKESNDATSPIWALNYKMSPVTSFYFNHTETFSEGDTVGSGYLNAGSTIPPEKTKQNEIGIKIKDKNILHTISLFRNTQQDGIDVPDKDDPTQVWYALDGENRYMGVEYSAVGALSKKWDMIFGIAYMNAEKTHTEGGENDGRKVCGIPKWSGDLALTYKPDNRTKIFTRINYTGTTRIHDTSSYEHHIDVPSITLFDVGASYKTKIMGYDTTITAMCYNLFNREYWYANGDNSIGLGAPRTFAVTASFQI